MKTTLFVLLGLVAVFSAVTAADESIASELAKEVAENGLTCDDAQIQNHCVKSNPGRQIILTAFCPELLSAYLCDHKTTDEALKPIFHVVHDIISRKIN